MVELGDADFMQLCLFDIDGTLVATGGAGQHAFALTLAEEFGVAEVATDVSFAGRSDRAITMDLFARHGVEPSPANWHRFREGYVSRMADALVARQGRVLPGVQELIGQVQARGSVLVGLLTGNVRAAAEKKLGHYGLWHHFPFGGFGDDHLERDDIARSAVEAARSFASGGARRHSDARESDTRAVRSEFDTIVVIGDTPLDVRCARAIGARSVAVPTGQTSRETLAAARPDLLVETLTEAAPILKLFGP